VSHGLHSSLSHRHHVAPHVVAEAVPAVLAVGVGAVLPAQPALACWTLIGWRAAAERPMGARLEPLLGGVGPVAGLAALVAARNPAAQ